MKSSVISLLALSGGTAATPFLQPRADQRKPVKFLGPNKEIPITPFVIEAQRASQLAPKAAGRVVFDGGPPTDNLISFNNGYQHMISVKINNSPFYLVLDTGSSNTWVMQKEYVCISRDGAPLPDKKGNKSIGDGMNCHMGPGYEQKFKPTEFHSAVGYADNTTVGGPLGYADMNIANLNIPDQLVRNPDVLQRELTVFCRWDSMTTVCNAIRMVGTADCWG
jgi:hypothetical protein